jgi:Cu/Ag efflux pump CusA
MLVFRASQFRSLRLPVVMLMTVPCMPIGLVPTALGLEAGIEANGPLARVVVGELTSSTVLSLCFVPVLFLLFAPLKAQAAEPSSQQALPVAG